MRYFPIFLDLQDRPAVIVGGGEEALRKVRLLERTGARLQVVAPELHEELARHGRVEWIARRFEARLLDGAALAVCADRALNQEVFAAAKARNVPVNAVDEAESSTFLIPSIVDRDPVVVAIGTEGAAPVLGQKLRARIDALLPTGLGALARQAAALRGHVAATLREASRRRSFWQAFFRDQWAEPASWPRVETLLAGEASEAPARVTFIAVRDSEADLLTLCAQRRLMEADAIVHDGAPVVAALEMARRDAARLAAGSDGLPLLLREARDGVSIVRLTAEPPPWAEVEAAEQAGLMVECLSTTPRPRKSRTLLRAVS